MELGCGWQRWSKRRCIRCVGSLQGGFSTANKESPDSKLLCIVSILWLVPFPGKRMSQTLQNPAVYSEDVIGQPWKAWLLLIKNDQRQR